MQEILLARNRTFNSGLPNFSMFTVILRLLVMGMENKLKDFFYDWLILILILI